MTFAIQILSVTGNWRIMRPLHSSPVVALAEFDRSVLALPSAHIRLVDAVTLQVLATSQPALLPAATQQQPVGVQ